MASMKLFKRNNSYNVTKSNYSEAHEEYSSQSNYANNAWAGQVKQPAHNYQAHKNQMGGSMHGGNNGPYGHGSTKKSTNYYADAQSAQPSPIFNVVQSAHVGSPKFTSPTQSTRSEFTSHREEYITEKRDLGSVNNPNYVSGPTLANQVGLVVHEEEYISEKMEQGWANKPTLNGLGMYEEDHMMSKMDSNLVNKSTKHSSTIGANKYGQSMYKEQERAYNYSEGGIEPAWVAKPTKYLDPHQSSPSHTNNIGVEVQREEYMVGKLENNLINKPTNHYGQNGAEQYVQTMCKNQQEDAYNYGEGGVGQGWVTKPTKYLSPIRTNDTVLGVRKEDNMMGKIDQSWANSPSKFANPQINHSNLGMHKEEHMVGKIGYEPNSPSNLSSPLKNNNMGLETYEEEHIMEKSDHILAYPSTQLSGPIQGNHFGQSIYGSNSANGSWAKQPNKYSNCNELGYSAHNNKAHGVAQNGYGSGQVNHSAYSAVGNAYGEAQSYQPDQGVAQNGFGAGQVNHSPHAQYGYRSAQVNLSAQGSAQNGYGASQVNYSAYGADRNGQVNNDTNYGSSQNGYGSGHGAYNYQDNDEAYESVHDIMDEILTKYPAHNVSGGHENNWAQKPNAYRGPNQGSDYANMQSFGGGPAQHEIVTQSSSKKIETKKEFSRSGSNKFDANNDFYF